eukprot:NODE_610_length_1447_cov_328.279454.p1 GENE.NODE_610_length_1447_cov_328.279454~~NODE_610_length_1447_cov_328.279454.p1  ORF type:complete len:425 (-),score=149.09 NODE_610_length_1447_cov_328.279454:155-1288(-)
MARIYAGGEMPELANLVSDRIDTSTAEAFKPMTFDVTNTCERWCGCLCTLGINGLMTKTIDLRADDMSLITQSRLENSESHVPYGQIENVDITKSCCCCYAVNGYSPGCGCNRTLVEEVASELQQRKMKRGATAQLKQLETMQSVTCALDVKLDTVYDKLSIQYPPNQETMDRIYQGRPPKALRNRKPMPHIDAAQAFETRQFNVTNYCELICTLVNCVGPTTREMVLEPEEMLLTTKNWCLMNTQRTPYAQLGSVDVETACLCCSNLPDVATPGCGCNRALVDDIAEELQKRKVKRGNIAQMKMQENMMTEILKVSTKVEILNDHYRVPNPPSLQTLTQVFGADAAAVLQQTMAPAVVVTPGVAVDPPGANSLEVL